VANFSVDHHGLALNSDWNYYQYNEGPFVGPTAPRYYHANTVTSPSVTLSSLILGSDNANNCQGGFTDNKAISGLREIQADSASREWGIS
jgi:hypothetical protein